MERNTHIAENAFDVAVKPVRRQNGNFICIRPQSEIVEDEAFLNFMTVIAASNQFTFLLDERIERVISGSELVKELVVILSFCELFLSEQSLQA